MYIFFVSNYTCENTLTNCLHILWLKCTGFKFSYSHVMKQQITTGSFTVKTMLCINIRNTDFNSLNSGRKYTFCYSRQKI